MVLSEQGPALTRHDVLQDCDALREERASAWAREAFTVPNLNRVQSKVFPITFGTDQRILLCAPTGTGKVRLLFDMQLQLPNQCPHRQTSPF